MYTNIRQYLVFLFIVFTTTSTYAGAAPSLTLQEAETLALEMDPGSKRFQSLARSMQERSIADGQLPDPKFRFGLMNFPVDTFNRDQEPMTQIQFGMQQQFPRGDSLDIKSQRTLVDANYNSLLRDSPKAFHQRLSRQNRSLLRQ